MEGGKAYSIRQQCLSAQNLVLAAVGYTANVAQNDFTLSGIFVLVSLVPVLVALLMLIIFDPFYRLRESDVEKYIKENAKNEVQTVPAE